jgi:two-component system sensor histidine kinase ChvG
MEPFDLGRLCEGLAGMFEDRAENHGVKLVLDLPTAPLMARGLEGRIGQVISNFIDNAISFSPEGGEVRLVARRLQDGGVGVGVMDDGPGVPPDNLESVFKRFYTERPESQGFGNHSGLGLAISRQIVEAHGGRIWVENREGPEGATGAHFRFELPE